MDRDREHDTEEGSAPPSKTDLVLAQLKVAGRYAMFAAPVVSVAALVVAVVAMNNSQSKSDHAKLGELTARLDSLNTSLEDTKAELDTLKLVMAHEKTMHSEERKKEDMLDEKFVQSVSRLQVKFKVSPTLESQLREMASAAAAASAPVAAIPAADKKAAAAPVSINVDKNPAAVAQKPIVAANKAVAAPAKPKSGDKTQEQVKALKEAIEKFNK